jgi:SAM-dependent methyltransferase
VLLHDGIAVSPEAGDDQFLYVTVDATHQARGSAAFQVTLPGKRKTRFRLTEPGGQHMQTVIDYRGKTKYDVSTALAYKDRPARQQFAEMALLDQVFTLVAKSRRVLDLPCGGGRVSVHLARQGYQVSGADHSVAMLQIARQGLADNGLDCCCSIAGRSLQVILGHARSTQTVLFSPVSSFPDAEHPAKSGF